MDSTTQNGDAWDELQKEIVACRKCLRLVQWREEVARVKRKAFKDWRYWGKPVPGFGDKNAQILVVGLAPGAHGSNRTGRMFTGDASGDFLYPALYRAGFANQPNAESLDDGMTLTDIFITAVGRCAPPGNKPESQELQQCQPFLLREMALLSQVQGIVALGSIAFHVLIKILQPHATANQFIFSHGALYEFPEKRLWLMASYHPSRQNTQTGRLTPEMFDGIWSLCRARLSS